MSANFTVLLVAAGLAAAAASAALVAARGARRELSALRRDVRELRDLSAAGVPAPRETPVSAREVRSAVAEALADERERELAEARAFWAEQEARESAGDGFFRTGLPGFDAFEDLDAFAAPDEPRQRQEPGGAAGGLAGGLSGLPYLPRQADFAGLEPPCEPNRDPAREARRQPGLEKDLDAALEGGREAAARGAEPQGAAGVPGVEAGAQAPEAAGATDTAGAPGPSGATGAPGPSGATGAPGPSGATEAIRPAPGAIPHPSGPDFAPSPVVASRDQTADRLADLADGRIPLSDVRPGPLGTLDVYVFADGTTLCMTPGHRETALKLCDALDRGEVPVLQGGSAIAGAYALTFAYGEESVYILADRVVASL
ncbi:hypothetical protein [Actinacidiphila sp. DG2A-62]|uniref:hypothetical protein n=1 Tax=Actinacidiphila sp. DG2A-62 TaxID=3108821 RepID=UPI003FA3B039